MQKFNTQIISTIDEFASSAGAWNNLADRRIFHQWQWMFSWWESFHADNELTIVVVRDDLDRWIGIAPWYKSTSVSRGRVIRTLGSGSACSDYVGLSVREGYQAVFAAHLAQAIGENKTIFGDVDLFEFEGHLGDDSEISALSTCLQQLGYSIDQQEVAGTWRSSLPQTWDEYAGRLHKSFRRKTKKAAKRLNDPDFEAVVFWSPDEIEKNWSTFVDLHQKRRNSLGEPGCFVDPKFESFLKQAVLRLSETAKAQLNLIKYRGQPLATNLELLHEDSVFMYQTGMDPELLNLEPGHITFTWAIQSSIEREYNTF